MKKVFLMMLAVTATMTMFTSCKGGGGNSPEQEAEIRFYTTTKFEEGCDIEYQVKLNGAETWTKVSPSAVSTLDQTKDGDIVTAMENGNVPNPFPRVMKIYSTKVKIKSGKTSSARIVFKRNITPVQKPLIGLSAVKIFVGTKSYKGNVNVSDGVDYNGWQTALTNTFNNNEAFVKP